MMLKIRSPASSIAKTAKEFAERTSVHGVGYVADKNVPLFSNLLWAFVCILSMSLAIYLSVESYNQWQERPVITTLKNTAKPVTEIPFPTVTICGSGLYMKNVEIALEKSFNQWRLSNKKSWNSDELNDLLAEFMEEKFQMRQKGLTIMDILNTMISSHDVNAVLVSNVVRENALACDNSAANEEKHRKKRSTGSIEYVSSCHFLSLLITLRCESGKVFSSAYKSIPYLYTLPGFDFGLHAFGTEPV